MGTLLFGGSLIPIGQAPTLLRICFYGSPYFWAIGAGVLIMMQHPDVLPECTDLLTCTLYNGGFLSYYLGYAPYTTSMFSMVVLVCMAGLATAMELVVLWYRVRQPTMSKHVKSAPKGPKNSLSQSHLLADPIPED